MKRIITFIISSYSYLCSKLILVPLITCMILWLGGCKDEVDPLANVSVTANIPSVFGVNQPAEASVSLANQGDLAIASVEAKRYPVSIVDASSINPIICLPASQEVQINSTAYFSCTLTASDYDFSNVTHTLNVLVGNQKVDRDDEEVVVSKFEMLSSASQALPANIEKDTSYPVVFSFTNLNATLPITGMTGVVTPEGFTETSNTCSTGTLAANSTCQISGTFKASVTGAINLKYTLSSIQHADLVVEFTTNVTDVDVSGSVATPLPANIEKDTSYPLVFNFSNANTLHAATGVTLSATPAGFTVTSNTCSTGTIVAGGSCQIIGTFIAPALGAIAPSYTLSYNQGAPVVLTSNSNVTDVDVSATISTPLATNIEKNVSYPIVFTFSNLNTQHAATNVTITTAPTGFTETSNTCNTGTISASGSCQIVGTFTASILGAVSPSYTLTYREGDNVTIASNTQVVSGRVYIGQFDFVQGTSLVKTCTVNSETGLLTDCLDTGGTGFDTIQDIVLNEAGTKAFITNLGPQVIPPAPNEGYVRVCDVNPTTGMFSNCINGDVVGATLPSGIALNASGTRIFITNIPNVIFTCDVNVVTGAFSNCENSGEAGILIPSAIRLNASGSKAFIINFLPEISISVCDVNESTGAISNCTNVGASIINAKKMHFNYAGNKVYVTNYTPTDALTLCDVNVNTGAFSNCATTGSGFITPDAVILNTAGTKALVANAGNETIRVCDVDAVSGALTSCIDDGSDFLNAGAMAYWPKR